MKKLSSVNWIYRKKANEQDKLNKWCPPKDGYMDGSTLGGWAELKSYGNITLEECKEICEKILKQMNFQDDGEQINKIMIDISVYNNFAEDGRPSYFTQEYPMDYENVHECRDKERTCYYYPDNNIMRIWENGRPVYENANGLICNDVNILSDNLM